MSQVYAPILKWRPAEIGMLSELTELEKRKVLPVIEITLPSPVRVKDDKRTPEEKFESRYSKLKAKVFPEVPSQIKEAMGSNRVILEMELISKVDVRSSGLKSIMEECSKLGLKITPSISLNADKSYERELIGVVSKYGEGLCLRLKPRDFNNIKTLEKEIERILEYFVLGPEEVDILVDTEDLENDEKYSNIFLKTQGIDNVEKLRKLIFANGSFPVNLSEFKTTETNLVTRKDWLRWHSYSKRKLKREPTFSDYSVRHPLYDEKTLHLSPSCSIKYTLDNEWQILKGYKHQYQYYAGYAVALVADDSFPGAGFSSGDKFFAEKASKYDDIMKEFLKSGKAKGVGQNVEWIQACLSHHTAVVLKQLSKESEEKFSDEQSPAELSSQVTSLASDR